MAADVTPALTFVPPIVAGIIIGLYESILIHRDVTIPTHRFGHGLHAFIFALVASFFSFNVPLLFQLIPALKGIPVLGTVLGVRILIGIIMMVKIHGVSQALKSTSSNTAGLGETWTHSLLIGALTVVAPYIWPFVAPVLPSWMK